MMFHAKFQDVGLPVLEILKVLTIYGRGGHLGHVKIIFPFPRRLHMKVGFDWSSGLKEVDL